MKKDISANTYQKCLILCSETVINVPHNMSRTVWLTWQPTGFQTSTILKAFLATLGVPFCISKWCLVCLIQQAYKDVSPSLWPHLMFCELKITKIFNLKSREWELKKSELPWEQNFYSCRCVLCRTISLPSFNGMLCKLTKIALFIFARWNWVECMTSSVISFA